MDTLLDKVMQLFVTNLSGLGAPRVGNAAGNSKMQRLRQTITELLQTEAEWNEQRAQLERMGHTILYREQQARELDAEIDNHLLAGDERRAAASQQALNILRARIRTSRIHHRRLAIDVERLRSELDRLEVKLAIQGVERKTLDEMIRRVQSEPRRAHSDGRWRVVDPE